jgi:putative polyketide hydroxylase
MTAEQLPTLIVGAGGAGLAAALLLLQQDLPAVVVERRDGISWIPRARNINFRTLEVLRSLGIADQVHAAGARASRMYRKDTVAESGEGELLNNPLELIEGLDRISPEPLLLYCPQSRLDPVMRTEVLRRGGEIRYGCELVSFTQDTDGVTGQLLDRGTGTTSTIRADYLIAADGAHSRVRGACAPTATSAGSQPRMIPTRLSACCESCVRSLTGSSGDNPGSLRLPLARTAKPVTDIAHTVILDANRLQNPDGRRLSVSSLNQRSTRFSHELEVGV